MGQLQCCSRMLRWWRGYAIQNFNSFFASSAMASLLQPPTMSLGEFAACTSPTRYSGDTISTPGGYSRDTRVILRRSSCRILSRKPVGVACDQHFQTHLQFHLKVPGPKRRPSKQRIAATAHASEGMSDKVLITFDVDGTLMEGTGLQANLLHKKAFSHAFLQVFGVEGTIDAIKVSWSGCIWICRY
jgi:hypothetical protein